MQHVVTVVIITADAERSGMSRANVPAMPVDGGIGCAATGLDVGVRHRFAAAANPIGCGLLRFACKANPDATAAAK